jgi:dihydropteroate synthase
MDILSYLSGPRELRLPRGRSWRLGRRPSIQGILNVTPDSFSDGGSHADVAAAVDFALRMVADGADVIDVGGESTRPGAEPVSTDEQCRRILDVIAGIRARSEVPISVDTRDPEVGRSAIESGADIVNDVSGLADPGWRPLLRARPDVPAIVMHMRGEPTTMQRHTDYPEGVLPELVRYFRERLDELERQGIASDRIVIDPGFGFAKEARHNLEILRGLGTLRRLERPILIGLSRKLFLGRLLGRRAESGSAVSKEPRERDVATVVANVVAVLGGATVLRVHNVPYARDLADVIEGLARIGPEENDR